MQPLYPRAAAVLLGVSLLLANAGYAADAGTDPSLTTYGTLHPDAPAELRQFSFMVGKWTGMAKSLDQEGKWVEYPMEWIGRYILDGKAIADEMRATSLPNNPIVGMTFRSFDQQQGNWVIEFLNVSGDFLRRQVGRGYGEVQEKGKQLIILQAGPAGALVREVYERQDENHFRYSLALSNDEGLNWEPEQVVIEMKRAGD